LACELSPCVHRNKNMVHLLNNDNTRSETEGTVLNIRKHKSQQGFLVIPS